MTTSKEPYYFLRMKRKYQLLRGTEILLWSVAIGLLSFYILELLPVHLFVSLSIGLALFVIAIVVGISQLHVFNINEKDLAHYLNRHYPTLEESADLLLEEDQALTSLQLLQKSKVIRQFEALYSVIKLPHHIGRAFGVFVFTVISCIGLSAFLIDHNKTKLPPLSTHEKLGPIDKKKLPAFIKNATLTISPPVYTGLKNRTSADFNLEIPEGSIIEWDIQFEGKAIDSKIILSARDSIRLSGGGKNGFRATKSFNETGFYQIAWKTADSLNRYSDYYKIEVIKDHPPVIEFQNLTQFLELTATDNLKIELKSTLTDDYGLSAGFIIATVSKGSGEAIKFREEKLAFDSPKKISGKKLKANRSIDLKKLGLEPGDELYFYVEALDIKTPKPNRTRTETYFISLQDTSSQVISVDAGLGVDLMPEYFRSQRQIIIDSEKLLKEKKGITKQIFNERSNELGYDQKVLRLRYGEFLGEEFDSGIGPQHEIPEGDSKPEEVVKKFGHDHDTENEHNLVDDKKGSAKSQPHDHAKPINPDQKADPIKEYVHEHDSEEATFFVQSIKAKLKAAVTIMWDAELYLRLYQPEKSLPYQYKALKLLKEISQDSRIYVHRTGFDPPPLKEEKRLTGDLSEIINSTSNMKSEKDERYPQTRNAILVVEKLLQTDSIVLPPDTKSILIKAGQEMAALALKQPTRYLRTLSLIKNITQEEVAIRDRRGVLFEIRAAFWNVIPPETMSPHARSGINHDLDLRFVKDLEALKQNN